MSSLFVFQQDVEKNWGVIEYDPITFPEVMSWDDRDTDIKPMLVSGGYEQVLWMEFAGRGYMVVSK